MICIACNHPHEEKFCPNCGEKSNTKKITFSSVLEDAISSITNMDKGFLYNIKALFVNPPKFTSSYIKGKRKGILNPISFLIITITIYIIVITVFKSQPKEVTTTTGSYFEEGQKIGNAIGLFLRTYIKYFWVLAILPLGLSLKIISKKYSFLEHIVISSFVIGQATLVGLISYLIFRFPLILDPFVYAAITFLIYKIYKKKTDKFTSALLAIGAFVIFFFQLILVTLAIGFVISKYS